MVAAFVMSEPPNGTVERWAWDFILTKELAHKLAPPALPSVWESTPLPRRIDIPGRPRELAAAKKRTKTPGPNALRDPKKRAELLHVFLHHELQAAELMCRALLLFSDHEPTFRRGLLRIAQDEVRHMEMYERHLRALGYSYGSFPVRDWFWERVPRAESARAFVAMMGIGFEGANLDHTRRFADAFRAAGDEEGARLQELVGDEEIPHVRFATQWYMRWTKSLDFESWRATLPPPLSPIVMRGFPLDRSRRVRAGLNEQFIHRLEAFVP
jgi:uncharacterized ferritin-like protein (DUF455 family)